MLNNFKSILNLEKNGIFFCETIRIVGTINFVKFIKSFDLTNLLRIT